MDEKVLTAKDLKERFVNLRNEVSKAQNEFVQMQQAIQSKQTNINHIQGALQDTVDLMVQLIGEEAVKSFIEEINKPQEVKQNGEKN